MKTFYLNYVTNGVNEYPLYSSIEDWHKGEVQIVKEVLPYGVQLANINTEGFKPFLKEVTVPFEIGDYIKRDNDRMGFKLASMTLTNNGSIWLGSEWQEKTSCANGYSYRVDSDNIKKVEPTEFDKVYSEYLN